MEDYISRLPNDVLCYILSLLTVREATRVRLLSSRWKDLPDHRSILQFDAHNVFGNAMIRYDSLHKSEFVRVVDQYMKFRGAQTTSALKIKFLLWNEYASHVDGWIIASIAGNQVEELDLDFMRLSTKLTKKGYVFPCHLLQTEKVSSIKRLQLKCCHLTLAYDACSSWLSKLSTIELSDVRLCLSDLECILSTSSNLESLCLIKCELPETLLCIKHPSLKRLIVSERCQQFELKCQRLEMFKFTGHAGFTFSHAPYLREVSLEYIGEYEDNPALFGDLIRNMPQLQTLSYWVTTEIRPLPPSATMTDLKCLTLGVNVEARFDVFTITNLLQACPILESFTLKVRDVYDHLEPIEHPPRQCIYHPHFHLKEVTFEGYLLFQDFVMDVAEYLLRNSISLQQMSFTSKYVPNCSIDFTKLQNLNPSVKLIFIKGGPWCVRL